MVKAIVVASAAYERSWSSEAVENEVSCAEQQSDAGSTRKWAPAAKQEWFFHAAQFTYNSTEGEWACTDKAAVEPLFVRFVAFAKALSGSL